MPLSDPYALAQIRIKNLRLRTYIGINEDEIKNRQDVVINAQLTYAADRALASQAIDEALNYRTLTKRMIAHVEQGRFSLLETLTRELLDILMSHSSVLAAEVEVDKPHALRFADSVSVTLKARRPAQNPLGEQDE